MAHLLTATDIAVERLHQFARVEAVALAQVDKQAVVALLRFVHAFLLVALWLLLPFIGNRLLYLRRIGIIEQEAAKLATDNLLDQFILVDIFEVSVDVVHKRGYLVVVDIGLHNLVHHLVELLLAYLLSRRDGGLDKCLSDLFLDIADLVLFFRMDDTD